MELVTVAVAVAFVSKMLQVVVMVLMMRFVLLAFDALVALVANLFDVCAYVLTADYAIEVYYECLAAAMVADVSMCYSLLYYYYLLCEKRRSSSASQKP